MEKIRKLKALSEKISGKVWHVSQLMFLLTVGLTCQVSANVSAQVVHLQAREHTLQAIFNEVEKQAGLLTFFSNNELDMRRTVRLQKKDFTIKELYQVILEGTQLQAEIINNYVVIRPAPPALPQTQPKERTLTGQVTDDKGEPLPGVTIMVLETTTGTSTDLDGKYSLKVKPGSTLKFSFVGMKEQIIRIGDKDILNVVLKPDSETLEEVVVTGMAQMDKRLFTGATDQLNAGEVIVQGMPDVSRALEGRSAGVTVQNVSGTFGTAPKIRVRGATSIYGSSRPLWVVDGVVMEDVVELGADDLSSGDAVTLISSAIAGLSSDDIESFQILKDGSATSIYGARAMAGVIVVTTKKGKAGVSHINYSGEFTVRMVPSYTTFNIMNSQDQMRVYKEMQEKGWLGFAKTYRASESGVYGKMYQLINTYDPVSGSWELANTPEACYQYLGEAERRNTNWFKELFKNSLAQNHSISLSSGTEKAQYYTSLSLYHDPGWSKASSVNRYTANVNASFNILPNLSINLISNGSYRKQKAPGTLSQQIDVVSGEVKRDFDINPYSYALNTSRALAAKDKSGYVYYTRNYAPFNILNELDNNYIDLNMVDLKFQGELKWKILSGLEAKVLGAVKYQNSSQEHNVRDNSNQALAYRAMADATIRDANPFLYKDPDIAYSLPISILPKGGIYKRTNYKMFGIDFRATLSYNKIFRETHIFNFFGGMETSSIERQETWFNGLGYQYEMGGNPFFDYNAFKQLAEENGQYYDNVTTTARNVAFFGTATYSFRGKYTLNGTLRYEGSNKLGKSKSSRWLSTWNTALAWNVHEESFFESLEPALSHLTLRASYSLTADRGPAFVSNSRAIYTSYSPYRPSSTVKESGIQISSLENSELTYEKKHELNLGADLGFLDNRINFTLDYYTRNNYDLIGLTSTQGAGGETQKYANVASMKSRGVEFTLSTKNIQTKDFSWSTDFIFSKNKNEVTKLDTRSRVIDLITGNGFALKNYPVRSLFSMPFRGLNKNGLPLFLNHKGDITITDINFQEMDNLSFLKYEGPTEPTITGSFGNIFTYKNFRLNIFITYSFGNVIRLDPVFSNSYSDLDAMPKEFKNRWMLPGDEAFTNIPVIASKRQNKDIPNLSYAYNAYNYSDARIADGGFIRMKEISLSYNFPEKWISRLKLNNLQLKVQTTNPFLIYADSKLNGQDPEFFRSGGVSAPVPKQFTFTLKFGF